jgi:hypothetical protein
MVQPEPEPEPQPHTHPAVVFFDVDGVLNTTAPDSPSLGIEAPLLANLAALAGHRQPTMVVLSSDWRRRPDLTERARLAVEQVGLRFGGTVEPRLAKPDAIKLWLAQHGSTVVNWLAIDDHDLEGVDVAAAAATSAASEGDGVAVPSVFAGHFLRTDDAAGLTAEHVGAGAAMLSAVWEQRAVDLARMESARQLPLEEATPVTTEKRLRCDDCGVELAGAVAAQEHMETSDQGCCMFSEV